MRFFTTWIITIYNTTAMYYDVASFIVLCYVSESEETYFYFRKCPNYFMANMIPSSLNALSSYGTYLAWIDMGCVVLAPLLVLIVYKIKRRNGGNETPS